MARRAINLEGLREDEVKAVEAFVETLRQKHKKQGNGKPGQVRRERVRFNIQPGTVHGDLTREEIYEDER